MDCNRMFDMNFMNQSQEYMTGSFPYYGESAQMPMPFYKAHPMPMILAEEQKADRDTERMKSMYPEVAKSVQVYVDDECDKMEYDGSMMFDEVPDRIMLLKLCKNIYDKVKDRYEVEDVVQQDDMLVMNRDRRPSPRPPRKNWLHDMVEVLLYNEMHRRRCRHNNCRRWY